MQTQKIIHVILLPVSNEADILNMWESLVSISLIKKGLASREPLSMFQGLVYSMKKAQVPRAVRHKIRWVTECLALCSSPLGNGGGRWEKCVHLLPFAAENGRDLHILKQGRKSIVSMRNVNDLKVHGKWSGVIL